MVHSGPIRALLVEGQPGGRDTHPLLPHQCLGSTVETSCAERLGEALRCLERDIAILDLALPYAAGLEGRRRIVAVVPHVSFSRELHSALNVISIAMHDSLIVGRNGHASLRGLGHP
jgi:hypothetical protein